MKVIAQLSELSTKYCKQIEAIGLALLIGAATFQFWAESARRHLVETEILRVAAQVEYNRMHVARLFRCSTEQDCSEFEYNHIMLETAIFADYDFGSPEKGYRNMRLVFFLCGSLLVVLGKFADFKRDN